jgi:hypothetical protein
MGGLLEFYGEAKDGGQTWNVIFDGTYRRKK